MNLGGNFTNFSKKHYMKFSENKVTFSKDFYVSASLKKTLATRKETKKEKKIQTTSF